MLFDATFAVTGIAGISDDGTVATAFRTGLLNREKTLLHTHLAMPTTGTACLGTTALLCTTPGTASAMLHGRYFNLYRGTRRPHLRD